MKEYTTKKTKQEFVNFLKIFFESLGIETQFKMTLNCPTCEYGVGKQEMRGSFIAIPEESYKMLENYNNKSCFIMESEIERLFPDIKPKKGYKFKYITLDQGDVKIVSEKIKITEQKITLS